MKPLTPRTRNKPTPKHRNQLTTTHRRQINIHPLPMPPKHHPPRQTHRPEIQIPHRPRQHITSQIATQIMTTNHPNSHTNTMKPPDFARISHRRHRPRRNRQRNSTLCRHHKIRHRPTHRHTRIHKKIPPSPVPGTRISTTIPTPRHIQIQHHTHFSQQRHTPNIHQHRRHRHRTPLNSQHRTRILPASTVIPPTQRTTPKKIPLNHHRRNPLNTLNPRRTPQPILPQLNRNHSRRHHRNIQQRSRNNRNIHTHRTTTLYDPYT